MKSGKWSNSYVLLDTYSICCMWYICNITFSKPSGWLIQFCICVYFCILCVLYGTNVSEIKLVNCLELIPTENDADDSEDLIFFGGHGIFIDESRLKWHHTDGRAWVRRCQGERHIDVCVQGTDGYVGPSGMIWMARFPYRCKSELGVLDRTINQQVYRCVLQQSFLPLARAIFGSALTMYAISHSIFFSGIRHHWSLLLKFSVFESLSIILNLWHYIVLHAQICSILHPEFIVCKRTSMKLSKLLYSLTSFEE